MTTFQKLIGISALIILTFSFFLFYWFQIRPSQIKAKCAIQAKDTAIDLSKYPNPMVNKFNFTKKYEEFYKICLHVKGL